MIDNDSVFGTATVFCDYKDCSSELEIDGSEGYPPQFDEIKNEMDAHGWISKKIDGSWSHFCQDDEH